MRAGEEWGRGASESGAANAGSRRLKGADRGAKRGTVEVGFENLLSQVYLGTQPK